MIVYVLLQWNIDDGWEVHSVYSDKEKAKETEKILAKLSIQERY